jgi:hypothetical protein
LHDITGESATEAGAQAQEWQTIENEWENHAHTDRVNEGAGRDLEEEEIQEEEMAMATEALLAEEEYRREPPRPPVNLRPRIDPNHREDLPQEPHSNFRLRGGYEEPLANKPFVIKFPRMAGHPQTVNGSTDSEMDTDQASADGTNNVFAPFPSKIEWEIARWAKLRGPGSTSFSELMGIDGVSRL